VMILNFMGLASFYLMAWVFAKKPPAFWLCRRFLNQFWLSEQDSNPTGGTDENNKYEYEVQIDVHQGDQTFNNSSSLSSLVSF
jgi:hypothetical protein